MTKRRLKRHKKQGMNRRKAGARKPMSTEEKQRRKKVSEEQSIADKIRLLKKE